MQIPWLFPKLIFSLTFNKIPWLFPDFCQVWNFSDFSLTAGHPVCDVAIICAHNTATRDDVTSAHMVLHCFVCYLCRKWHIIVWHNLYRWRLGLLLTCDMKCDSEIRHAKFCEVRVNIFLVIQLSNAQRPSILWPCGEPGTSWCHALTAQWPLHMSGWVGHAQ